MEPLDSTFTARRDALWPQVLRPLRQLYGHRADFAEVLTRLERACEQAYADRSAELRALDQRRLVTPDWFQRPEVIGYVCYVDRFAGTLSGVGDRLEHLQQLGVTLLHLMPLLESRPAPNDGGYAVTDYRSVRPDLGTIDDLRELAGTLRGRGMSLVVDLVCNHTAAEHEWARRARAGEQKYRDYYWFYPDRTEPDRWEQTLPEVFPDFAPGNFSWLPDAEQWVWTTFNDYQWDLNYTNPAVFAEMLETLLFLANAGVEVLRLDAVAFMWKRLGTNCQNQPEAHLLLQAFRALTSIVAPGVLLLAEAIVAPDDLVDYLGRGEGTGVECQLAYHNVQMVMLWSALAEQGVRLTRTVLNAMPPIPPNTSWLTYARLHDDIGWAITDELAAAAGLDGFAHRGFLSDFYSGEFGGSYARGEVFQANPRTGDRRISGSLASLAGLEAALQLTGTERGQQVDLAVRRILLLHALVLSIGGLPLIHSGDELGQLNDRSYLADPDLAPDNRWMHRPPLDWRAAERRFDPDTVECRIFSGIANLVQARRRTPQLHAQAGSRVVDVGNDHVLGVLRESPRGIVLVLANVSARAYSIGLHSVPWFTPGAGLRDLISGHPESRTLRMEPYQVRWIAELPHAG
ncbi:amylosucrase [Enemella dayhoffiae]|nr:amylosucrase [Enemella dayhoffiae]